MIKRGLRVQRRAFVASYTIFFTIADVPLLPLSPHILQELLESYLIDFNSLESKIDNTRNQIQNAEELVSLGRYCDVVCCVCSVDQGTLMPFY